ncbi:MAG: hypothetical protein WCD18_04040 [Thermosynechococcaceae cyanobacterium]
MDAKQSLSVVLMLSLLAPLASCGEAQNGDNEKDQPQVESPAGSPADSPKEEDGKGKDGKKDSEEGEGGEGGEGGES